jgi:flagellar hook-associated protein 3 FlgL
MRVTGHMIRQKILRNMQSAIERLQFSQVQLATGKRILQPSDDPIGMSKDIRVRALLADKEQFQKNIEDALGWIDNTEPSVDQILADVVELKEIAIRGASDTLGSPERAALAQQVEHLIQQIVTLSNDRYGQRYVFAGTYTLTEPYTAQRVVSSEATTLPDLEWVDLDNARITQGTVTVAGPMGETYAEGTDYEIDYQLGRIRRCAAGSMNPGDSFTVSYETETICRVDLNVPDTSGIINREIAQGVYEGINTGGQEILASGTDILALMIRVKTDLYRNDGIAVNQSLNEIDQAIDQVSAGLGKLGARRSAFELAMAKLDSEVVNLHSIISSLEDADIAEVTVKFQAQQMAYESALAAAGKMMNMSLINFVQ